MRAVVTGGAGFIGSHLIEALVTRGDDVVCVDRPNASRRWIEGLPIRYLGIGLDDRDALIAAFRGADVVFHLAALTEAPRAADYYRVNTEGTAKVLSAAARHNGCAPRVIFLSSLAAIGPCRNGDLLGPDTVPFPLSHYGHSKLLAEAVIHAYADRVRTTILRLPAVFGPRERAVLKFFRMVKRGFAVTIGPWDREISMLYVKDLVQGAIAAADTPAAAGHTYCLAHPEPISWRGFARATARALRREPFLVSVPKSVARAIAYGIEVAAGVRRRVAILNRERVRELTQHRWVCDPSRAIRELGFRPRYSIPVGIAETATWYAEAQWL